MNCGHNKGVRILAELDSEKGIGLIKRVRQGMGKPTKIYVMNFLGIELEKEDLGVDDTEDFPKEEARLPKMGRQEFLKGEA